MRHLWVIEEKQGDEDWVIMGDEAPEVFYKKRHTEPYIREWRTCMPDHYRYRVVKYTPEKK